MIQSDTYTRKRMRWPVLIRFLAFLLGVWLLAACAGPGATSASTPGSTTLSLDDIDAAPRISLADAKARFDAGSALFLDVRSQEAYESAHIQGAIPIPLTEVEARMDELPDDRFIITYCS